MASRESMFAAVEHEIRRASCADEAVHRVARVLGISPRDYLCDPYSFGPPRIDMHVGFRDDVTAKAEPAPAHMNILLLLTAV